MKQKINHNIKINIEGLTEKALKEVQKNISKLLKDDEQLFEDPRGYLQRIKDFNAKKAQLREIEVSGTYPNLTYFIIDRLRPFGQENNVAVGYAEYDHSVLNICRLKYDL